MISIFIPSVLSQKTLQEILILNTNANYKEKIWHLNLIPKAQENRVSQIFALLFLKTKGQSKAAGGHHTNDNHESIKLSNSCHQEAENRLMSIHY